MANEPVTVQTILWPTDLSKASLAATPHVVSMASKYGARVVVLYVAVDLCSYFPAYGNYPSQEEVLHFQQWELKHAREKLDAICQGELKGCPMLEVKLVTGDAAAEILKTIDSEKADMVIMARRGAGAKGELTPGFGTVASKVLAGSRVPVQVI